MRVKRQVPLLVGVLVLAYVLVLVIRPVLVVVQLVLDVAAAVVPLATDVLRAADLAAVLAQEHNYLREKGEKNE